MNKVINKYVIHITGFYPLGRHRPCFIILVLSTSVLSTCILYFRSLYVFFCSIPAVISLFVRTLERQFSQAGLIYSEWRTSTKPSLLNDILLIRSKYKMGTNDLWSICFVFYFVWLFIGFFVSLIQDVYVMLDICICTYIIGFLSLI